jgi:N-carbamoyl-L-amino-acid hydrolase
LKDALNGHPDFELQECLRNIHRIVEIRLNDKTACDPTQGHQVWDWQEDLAQFSDLGFKENGQLTVTYLTEAHLACSASIQQTMKRAGFDDVHVDAVGNVVGRYHPARTQAHRYLLTGSHYDTVRNGGKYDGRLGIYVPIACVQQLASATTAFALWHRSGGLCRRRRSALQSHILRLWRAWSVQFNSDWLDQLDADGISMRDAMKNAGLNRKRRFPNIQRNPADYLGFIEVHIEQGPALE